MLETSALETDELRNSLYRNGVCLGRVSSVDAKRRFCEVKTFFGPPGLVDLHLENVQWLSTDANPDGDESTAIPRVNSTGLVFFVEGEPFIWGYFKATKPGDGAVTGKEQAVLNPGDKIMSTAGGNRIVVKKSGLIEIHSNESLKTIYFPREGLLSHICQQYSIQCDGGFEAWKNLNALNETLNTKEYRRDMARTTIVFEERGKVDSTVVKKVSIGPGIPGVQGVFVPVFTMETDLTGQTKCEVGLAGTGVSFEATPFGTFSLKNPFGSVELDALGGWEFKTPQASLKVSALGDIEAKGPIAEAKLSLDGKIEVKNALTTFSIAPSGETKIEAPAASVSISTAGEVKIEGTSKIVLDTKAGLDIKSIGPVKVEALGKVTVSGLQVAIDGTAGGGAGAINGVLCNPLTVSQFTGAPLLPFSTTVKVSP